MTHDDHAHEPGDETGELVQAGDDLERAREVDEGREGVVGDELLVGTHGGELLDVGIAEEELAFGSIGGGVGAVCGRVQPVSAGTKGGGRSGDGQEGGEGDAPDGSLRVLEEGEELEELRGGLCGHELMRKRRKRRRALRGWFQGQC